MNLSLRKIITIILSIIFVILSFMALYQVANAQTTFEWQVAAKMNGEGARMHPLAQQGLICSVKTRLEAGWRRSNVLSAYYARNVAPTSPEVDFAHTVLNTTYACQGEYFAYSYWDIQYLVNSGTFHNPEFLYTVCTQETKCIHFMNVKQYKQATGQLSR